MKRAISLFGLVLMGLAIPLRAQLAAPNAAGVALGHWHMVVRDVEANKKFWVALGGALLKIDGMDVIKLPEVLIFLERGSPAPAGNYGSTLNHTALLVRDTEESLAKWKAAGLTTEYVKPQLGEGGGQLGYVYTPDDLKIRLNSDKSVTTPVASPLVMFWVTKALVPQVAAWYSKMFGARPGAEVPNGIAVEGIPGLRVRAVASAENPLSRSPLTVGLVKGVVPDEAFVAELLRPGFMRPSKGRTLDHIGFEVTNLEAFCKKLEVSGVRFEQPYSKTRNKSFASAMFTDPWGTSIELSEGLRRF